MKQKALLKEMEAKDQVLKRKEINYISLIFLKKSIVKCYFLNFLVLIFNSDRISTPVFSTKPIRPVFMPQRASAVFQFPGLTCELCNPLDD